MNEIPSGRCSAPIIMGTRASNGAVIANFNGIDPDNENAINRDSYNTTVVVKNKQRLSYFMSPQQSSLPFKIEGNSLYKSGVSILKMYMLIIIIYCACSEMHRIRCVYCTLLAEFCWCTLNQLS